MFPILPESIINDIFKDTPFEKIHIGPKINHQEVKTRRYQDIEKQELKMKPLREHLLVTKQEGEKLTASGLVIPGTADKKTATGKVIKVGSGILTESGLIPLEVVEGDTVVYNPLAAIELKDENGNPVYRIRESDIFVVL